MGRVSAVVYTSNTGFTARYAEMLGRAAGLPVFDLKGPSLPERGSDVIYLGWLCAGGVKGLKKALRRWDVRAVCAVGLAPDDPAYAAKVAADNHLEGQSLFYLRGGYSPERLSGLYGLIMKPMSRMVARAPAEDAGAQAMREAFAQGGDWVSEQRLAPVLDWLAQP
ncbi:hypothetical protein CE91St41_09960 [Oscillospiraceae bacterium]|nr:hypothetical protein CE91St40_27570 [Oscillospiraceae bacterium]BDF74107.1 hypothetical protein CE91St41_09960 [Oscillospiraceae bacterium]